MSGKQTVYYYKPVKTDNPIYTTKWLTKIFLTILLAYYEKKWTVKFIHYFTFFVTVRK